MNNSSAQLKRMARAALAGKWGKAAAFSVLSMLITTALTFCTIPFESSTSALGMIIYWVITLIVSLLSGLFAAGACYFYLNICRGEELKYSDLFYAFKHNPDRFLIVALITGFPTFLSTIPTFFMNPVTDEEFMIYTLVVLVSVYAGAIISIIISLFFALSNYLLVDFDELGAIDSLRMSAHLMKGNKGRYFYISLSFIGWIFLALFTMGIALFWIEPYMNMTFTYFYADILNRNQPDNNETGQACAEEAVYEQKILSRESETEEASQFQKSTYVIESQVVDDNLFED